MALHGWMSPDGMEELLAADADSRNKELKEMPYDLLTDKDGLNLRPYQLNAIKAAEEAVISGNRLHCWQWQQVRAKQERYWV